MKALDYAKALDRAGAEKKHLKNLREALRRRVRVPSRTRKAAAPDLCRVPKAPTRQKTPQRASKGYVAYGANTDTPGALPQADTLQWLISSNNLKKK